MDTQCEQPMQDMPRVTNTPRLGGLIAPQGAIAGNQAQIVNIQKVLNGYIVAVGCQQVVFETREKMLSEVDRYLKNPSQVEKEYLERK